MYACVSQSLCVFVRLSVCVCLVHNSGNYVGCGGSRGVCESVCVCVSCSGGQQSNNNIIKGFCVGRAEGKTMSAVMEYLSLQRTVHHRRARAAHKPLTNTIAHYPIHISQTLQKYSANIKRTQRTYILSVGTQ